VPKLCHSSGVAAITWPEYRNCTANWAEARSFSIENRGACPRRARDRRVGLSRSAVPLNLHHLSLIHFLGSGWVGEKWKCLFYETMEGASEQVSATEKTTRHVPPSCSSAQAQGRLRFAFLQKRRLSPVSAFGTFVSGRTSHSGERWCRSISASKTWRMLRECSP
jgi:hypothetical protein